MMKDDVTSPYVSVWATRGLPARLDVSQTARLLGFAEHDVQILMAAGKLSPLGDPAPNAPKWFAAVQIIQFALDQEWLNRATKEVGKYWKRKRQGRSTPVTPSKAIVKHIKPCGNISRLAPVTPETILSS